jgi:hypothetical protein
VRLAGVQVPGLVRHQELALRVIHPCLICALLKHTVCGSAFHQKKKSGSAHQQREHGQLGMNHGCK